MSWDGAVSNIRLNLSVDKTCYRRRVLSTACCLSSLLLHLEVRGDARCQEMPDDNIPPEKYLDIGISRYYITSTTVDNFCKIARIARKAKTMTCTRCRLQYSWIHIFKQAKRPGSTVGTRPDRSDRLWPVIKTRANLLRPSNTVKRTVRLSLTGPANIKNRDITMPQSWVVTICHLHDDDDDDDDVQWFNVYLKAD